MLVHSSPLYIWAWSWAWPFYRLTNLGGALMDLPCNNYDKLFVKILSFLIVYVEISSFCFFRPHVNGLSSILWLVKNSPLFRTILLGISLWAWQCHTLRKLLRAWGMVKLFNILGALDESLSNSSIKLPEIASSISRLMYSTHAPVCRGFSVVLNSSYQSMKAING